VVGLMREWLGLYRSFRRFRTMTGA
jgi:hypothetical protein